MTQNINSFISFVIAFVKLTLTLLVLGAIGLGGFWGYNNFYKTGIFDSIIKNDSSVAVTKIGNATIFDKNILIKDIKAQSKILFTSAELENCKEDGFNSDSKKMSQFQAPSPKELSCPSFIPTLPKPSFSLSMCYLGNGTQYLGSSRYIGKVDYAIDLASISDSNITLNGNTVTVNLPQPTLVERIDYTNQEFKQTPWITSDCSLDQNQMHVVEVSQAQFKNEQNKLIKDKACSVDVSNSDEYKASIENIKNKLKLFNKNLELKLENSKVKCNQIL